MHSGHAYFFSPRAALCARTGTPTIVCTVIEQFLIMTLAQMRAP
jgi:hypothetical protein